jgi:hypothetical protein
MHRRHALGFVWGGDAIGDGLPGSGDGFGSIEAEADALGGGVRPVAGPTPVGEDRTNVAVEFERLRRQGDGAGKN